MLILKGEYRGKKATLQEVRVDKFKAVLSFKSKVTLVDNFLMIKILQYLNKFSGPANNERVSLRRLQQIGLVKCKT